MPVARQQLGAAALVLVVAVLAGAVVACGGGNQPDLASFCEKLRVASGPEGAIASLVPNDPDAAEVAAKELDSLHQAAPLEIKPALAAINDATGLVLAAFASSEGTGQESLQKMRDEMDAYAEAATELAQFAQDNCGLELNPGIP